MKSLAAFRLSNADLPMNQSRLRNPIRSARSREGDLCFPEADRGASPDGLIVDPTKHIFFTNTED